MTRLFPTLQFRAGESPISFASRLALRHRRSSVQIFLAEMGIGFQHLIDGDSAALQALARLTGVPFEQVSDSAIVKTAQTYRYRGNTFPKSSMRRARLMACPHCLMEDLDGQPHPWLASGRSKWLLTQIRACLRHRVRLIQLHHSSMPRDLHDFARNISGALPRLPEICSQAEVVEATDLERYLDNRLEGGSGPAWLDSLPLHVAAKTCELFGAVLQRGREAPLLEFSDEDWREVGAAGFSAIAAGPEAARCVLRSLWTTIDKASIRAGVKVRFGRIFTTLYQSQDDTGFDPVRQLLIDFVAENTPAGPEDQLFGKSIVATRRLHSVHTLSKTTGLHPKRLRKAVLQSDLVAAGSAGLTADQIIFDAQRGEELASALGRSVSQGEVEAYFLISSEVAKKLSDERLIRSVVSSEGGVHASYDRHELDRFLVSLTVGAQSINALMEGQHAIPSAAKKANCSIIEIVHLILGRKVAWVGHLKGAVGFASIIVDLNEIEQLTRPKTPHTVTFRDAEKAIGTNTAVIKALVRHGIFPTQRVVAPNRCPVDAIRREAVEAFKSQYCSLHQIARSHRMQLAAAKRQLADRGIHPAFANLDIPATFYERSKLPDQL